MKKLLVVLLTFSLVLSFAACAQTGTKPKETDTPTASTEQATLAPTTPPEQDNGTEVKGMTLIERGTAPTSVNFISGGLLVQHEDRDNNKKLQVLDQNGVAFNDIWYDNVEASISNGICIVNNEDASGKKLLGVVDSLNEKELLPCEAVEIAKLSDRFLLLGYETGMGTEDDFFGFYFTDAGMIYYTGYGKILDLEKGQIVPNLQITTSKYDVSAAGNMILVEGEYPSSNVYTADGSLLGSYDYVYAYPDSRLILQSVKEGVCVYDQDMKQISTLETADYNETFKPIDGTSAMLLHEYVRDGVHYEAVTDINGKAISQEYTSISTVYPEGYVYYFENEKRYIADFDGNIIASDFYSARYCEPGYLTVHKQQYDEIYVYDSTGKLLTETAMTSSNGLVLRDSSGNILILGTGKMLTPDGYVQIQTGSLVLIGNTLYDVITGKAVFTELTGCVATGNSLYIRYGDSDSYIRYIVEFN
ncbi:MAG: hypothetical protein IJE24_07030 [Oscillospiraceae bacterium]|nr:hypothetical protein [Oscillospiraceae bacterium]